MISIAQRPMILHNGEWLEAEQAAARGLSIRPGEGSIASEILAAHNLSDDPGRLSLRFDALASHDITYVGIVQTARASGLTAFPVPYVLTNCHNSLCAVGGTINEDDHLFGLSAAEKYGGEFVPAHLAVIHQYMRENYAASGKMILASDSHTRYGPYGTLAVGEGGPELVKQLLSRPYELTPPDIVAVYLTGTPRPGVGPQDVALALIAHVFPDGLVKNKILEFIGPGITGLSMDFRNGIDVMTTETTCLSSVWRTDETVRAQLALFGRADDYKELSPANTSCYHSLITLDLSQVEPMIALPFHPSRAYAIRVFNQNAGDMLRDVEWEAARQWGVPAPRLTDKVKNGKFYADQGVVVGCAGGLYENIVEVRNRLRGYDIGRSGFSLSVYPASAPMQLALTKNGVAADLMEMGVIWRSAFCGPCFGAGDVPGHLGFSLRHATRNFPNREGSKPGDGQMSFVALMDARSIAATAAMGGVLTAATDLVCHENDLPAYAHDASPYEKRVFRGVGRPQTETPLHFGPNIADWPVMIPLPDNISLTVAAAIYDPVTTTDELIPSGETSSYRSNPMKLASYTLSRKDPAYVGRAREIYARELARREADPQGVGLGSLVAALKPGDGSAREQAASCQRVLGGLANIAREYATKRYRSNLINWGMIPFVWEDLEQERPQPGDVFYISGIRRALEGNDAGVGAILQRGDTQFRVTLGFGGLTREERDIILAGCLINYYAK